MDTALLKKLKFDPSQPLLCINLPESCAGYLEGLALHSKAKKGVAYTQALFFSLNKAAVDALPPYFAALSSTAMVWAAYPKAGPLRSDINREKGWEPFAEAGYIPVSQISIDEDWAALWFKKKELVKRLKRAVPMEARITDGVDYVARTAVLPEDAILLLKEVDATLLDVFNGMAFSHRKEYVEAIAEAKKPETRLRRIEKMAEALEAWRNKKKTKS